jgi:hypothetical protein
MNYRILIVFFAGLVIGLLIRPFIASSDIEEETKRLSDTGSGARVSGRLVEPRSAAKHSSRPASGANAVQDAQDQLPASLNAAQLVSSVDDVEKRFTEQLAALQMSELTLELNLDERQQEEFRKLLIDKLTEERTGNHLPSNEVPLRDALAAARLRKHLLGELDVAGRGQHGTAFEASITSLLNEDQRGRYADYLKRVETNQVEIMAMQELARLQSIVPLTEEKKDRALAAFTELTYAQIDELPVSDDGGTPPDDMHYERLKERSLQALQSILSPAELSTYENGSWLEVAGGVARAVRFNPEPPNTED